MSASVAGLTVGSVIVDSALYRKGSRVARRLRPRPTCTSSAPIATGDGDFVWLGLHEPSEARARGRRRSPSGCTRWPSRTPSTPTSGPSSSATRTACSWSSRRSGTSTRRTPSRPARSTSSSGTDFVVTVRHGQGSELHSRAGSPRVAGRKVLTHGPSAVVYAVCDTRRRRLHRRASSRSQVDVDEVEESVFSPARTNDSVRIYTLKREIAEVRRAVMPLREPMRRFAAGRRARASTTTRRRSSATSPTTSPGPRTTSTPSTACSRPPSTPTSPGSRCSRTTTCARSRPASALVAAPTLIAGDLRHELRAHAGAGLDLRLPVRAGC